MAQPSTNSSAGKQVAKLMQHSADSPSGIAGSLSNFFTRVSTDFQLKNRPSIRRQSLSFLLPLVLNSHLRTGGRTGIDQFIAIGRLAVLNCTFAIDIVSLSSQMAVLVDKLVAGNACEVSHQMLRRFQLRNAVHLSKHRLPYRLQAIFGAVENLHLATAEPTSDRAADVWPVTVHQFFRCGHVPILKPVEEFSEMILFFDLGLL